MFAEQDWIAVAVNPTGSTGYGQAFVDAIQGQWGGKPYIDLQLAVKYLQTKHEAKDYIDFDNAVALGASYGGCKSHPPPQKHRAADGEWG